MIPVGRLFRPNERQVAQLAKKDYLGKATVGGAAHLSTPPVPWIARGWVERSPLSPSLAFWLGNEDLSDSKGQTLPVYSLQEPPVSSVIQTLSNSGSSSRNTESWG